METPTVSRTGCPNTCQRNAACLIPKISVVSPYMKGPLIWSRMTLHSSTLRKSSIPTIQQARHGQNKTSFATHMANDDTASTMPKAEDSESSPWA
jgi:hypothetical protein